MSTTAAGKRIGPAVGLWAVLAYISAVMTTSPSQAQTAGDFYKGKTVTLLVGSTPGGGYDLYARMLARFLGAHIPGNPAVVVQDMPGAGSLTSVLFLDNGAARDGTFMTIF